LSAPALATGVFAFADAAKGASSGSNWSDVVKNSSWGTGQWQFMKLHLLLMSASAGLILAAVIAWIGSSDHFRDRLHWIYLGALIVGMGGMGVGAWYGGEGVYRYGVAVAAQTAAPTSQPTDWWSTLKVEPGQLHLLLVGFTAALIFAALALTIRRWTVGPRPIAEEPPREIETRLIETSSQEPGENLPAMQHEPGFPPPPTALAEPPRIFAARWWLLAALLAVLTAAAGLWTTEAMNPKPWVLEETRGLVQKSFSPAGRRDLSVDQERMLIHLILGICIILLPLILALITRFSRRLMWPTIIGLVLLSAAVGVQVWKGVQLLYNL
jgi:uncharacterized membrane protein